MISMQRQCIKPAVHSFSGESNLFQLIRIVRGGKIRKALWARHCRFFSPQFLFCLIPLCQVRRCKTDPITLKLCRKTGGNTRGYSQKNPIRYERVGISVILVYKLKGQRANKLIYDIKESYFKDSAFTSSQSKGMHLAIEGMRKGYLLQSGSRQFWKMR